MSKSSQHIPVSRDSVSKSRDNPIPCREDKWPKIVIDVSESDGDDGAPPQRCNFQPSPWAGSCSVGKKRKGIALPSSSERDKSNMKESEDIPCEDNAEQYPRYDAADPAKRSAAKKGKGIAFPSASDLDVSENKRCEDMLWEVNAEQKGEADAAQSLLPDSLSQLLKVQVRLMEEICEGRRENMRVLEELADLKQRVNVLLDQAPASPRRKKYYKNLF